MERGVHRRLSGSFVARRRAGGGPADFAHLEIERRSEVDIARWLAAEDEIDAVPGLGFASGDVLAVARSGRADRTQGTIGLVEYVAAPDGGLDARWAHPSLDARIGSGRATPLTGDGAGVAGTYRIVYFDADGNQAGAPCRLSVEPTGAAWALAWTAEASGAVRFKGIGIEDGDRMLAAWGAIDEPCELVVLTPQHFDGRPGFRGRAISAPTARIASEDYVAAGSLMLD